MNSTRPTQPQDSPDLGRARGGDAGGDHCAEQDVVVIERDAVHEFFGLTYAQYLAIPRSVLQSMPDEWQAKFVALMRELRATIDWYPKHGCYRVGLWTERENEELEMEWDREIDDPLADYERGHRRIPHRTTT